MGDARQARDWLPLGFLIAGGVAGLVALAAAMLIRLELQQPGVQYLVDIAGNPDGRLFLKLGILHGLASTLFCVLPMMFAGLGYGFVPTSLGRDKTVLRPLGWVGLIALVVGFGIFVAAIFFESTPQQPSGWVLYPPLNHLAYEGSSSMLLANIGCGLGLLSLALVSIDFLVSRFVVRGIAEKWDGVTAWAFGFCGLAFLIGVIFNVVIGGGVRGAGLAVIDNDPLNLFLLLVSLAVAVSALSVGFRRGGNLLIVPLMLSLAYFAFVAYGAKQAFVLSQAGAGRALHDTYYVVAYVHFVSQSASLFAFFAGMNTVFPSIGRQLWFGIVQGILMVAGVVMSFLPQVFLGMQGMPRRYVDYPSAFEKWNYISSLGSLLTLVAIGLWVIILLRAVCGPKRVYD